MNQERTYTIELTEDELILIHIALGTESFMGTDKRQREVEELEKKLHDQRVRQFLENKMAAIKV